MDKKIKFNKTPMLKYMQNNNLSCRQFAKLSKVSRATVCEIRTSRYMMPTLITAYKLSKILKVPMEQLITE